MKKRLLCVLLVTAMCFGETMCTGATTVSNNSTGEIMEEGETTEADPNENGKADETTEIEPDTLGSASISIKGGDDNYEAFTKCLQGQKATYTKTFSVSVPDDANQYVYYIDLYKDGVSCNQGKSYGIEKADGNGSHFTTITYSIKETQALGNYELRYGVEGQTPVSIPMYIKKPFTTADNKLNTGITVKDEDIVYTGNDVVPRITVTDKKDDQTITLVQDKDYSLKITTENKKDYGIINYTITGLNETSDYIGTYTDSFDIIPESPAITSIQSAGFNSAKITWNKVPNVDGYVIEHRTENGTFTEAGTVGANVLTFTDVDSTIFRILTGETYYYRVCAYVIPKNTKDKRVTSIANEKGTAITISPAAPKLVSLISASYNKFTLTWEAVAGATGYEVYRFESDGSLKLIKTTPNTSYTITKDVVCGKTYKYTVKAYIMSADGSTRIRSDYNASGISAKAKPATPVLVSAKATAYNQVTIKWKTVSKAYGYYVYRKEAGNIDSDWTRIKTVKLGDSTSAVDKKAKTGVKYYYTVRAYTKVNGKIIKGDQNSKGLAAKAVPDKPKITLEKWGSDVNVKIQKVKGASGYMIYRSNDDGTYSKIGTISINKSGDTTVYKDANPGAGKTFKYYVKAYVTTEEKRVAGSGSKKVTIKM